MANEKLDKVRSENPENVLDVKDLDKVAGGNNHELADDSRFLNVLLGGAVCDRYGEAAIDWDPLDTRGIEKEITKAWALVGVKYKPNWGSADNYAYGHNEYWIGGWNCTQEQAREHAMKVTGRHLKREDWYW